MQKVIYLLLLSLVFFSFDALFANASVDSVFIVPDVDSITVCSDSEIGLTVSGGTSFSWSPEEDFDDPEAQTVILSATQSQWYYVTVVAGDTTCTDSIYVTVQPAVTDFAAIVSTTDTICPLDPVAITFDASQAIDAISWEPTDGVADTTSITGTDITPLETTEYIVTATFGVCQASDTFTIEVIPFVFRLLTEDTLYLCLGDEIQIRHQLLPVLGSTVVWSPLDTTIVVVNQVNATVNPTVSATYTATATSGECSLTTTTFVRVDSLPPVDLNVIPFKDPYCAGEEITIFAHYADTMKYPDIMFDWFPFDGQIQDSANTGNVFVIVQDTTEFFRYTINNACRDTSSILLNVIPPDLPLSVMDTSLCPGDKFTVEVLNPDVTDITWTPEQGIDQISDLVFEVTVQANPITYMVEGEVMNCSVTGMLNVSINPELNIPISPNPIRACPGDTIQFNFVSDSLTNIEVSISGKASVNCSNCNDPVVIYNGGTVQLNVHADELSDFFCGAFGGVTISMDSDTTIQLATILICPGVPTEIPLGQYEFVNPHITINNGSVSCSDCENPVVTTTEPTALMIVSDGGSSGNCVTTSTIALNFFSNDIPDFVTNPPGDPHYGQGEEITITLNTNPPPGSSSTFTWTVNGQVLTANTATVPIALNEVSNTILVEWINSSGCLQSYDTTIVTTEPGYRIPKAFTPGRELNTHFKIDIDGNIELVEMLVFNRWGKLIYEGTSLDGWDGRSDGEIAPPEVYAYLIRLRRPNGNVIIERGDVTLIR